MIMGFTGTRRGMTDPQKATFCLLFHHWGVEAFHHGDDDGSDKQAHILISEEFDNIRIEVHPPENEARRAFCEGDFTHKPKPYLERNKDIVDACNLLIVAPPHMDEELRSGTWSTYRYARTRALPLLILKPEGGIALCPQRSL